MTTLLREYFQNQYDLEQKYGKKSVVMIQIGKFYEVYAYDLPDNRIGKAVELASLLDIHLTQKNKEKVHSPTNPFMCGWPIHALNKYVSKLLSYQYTIAIYDQRENIQDGRFLRGVFSPGMVPEEIEDGGGGSNMLVCFHVETSPMTRSSELLVGVLILDLSIGRVLYSEMSVVRSLLYDHCTLWIQRYSPKEIVWVGENTISVPDVLVHSYASISMSLEEQCEALKKVYSRPSTKSIISDLDLDYYHSIARLLAFGLDFVYDHYPLFLHRIQKPEYVSFEDHVHMGHEVFRDLNLLTTHHRMNPSDKSKNRSLLDVIDHTHTSMGRRRLRYDLTTPIFNAEELSRRYDEIERMMPDTFRYTRILCSMSDVERLWRKIELGTITPHQCYLMSDSMHLYMLLMENEEDEGARELFMLFTTVWNISNMQNKNEFRYGFLNDPSEDHRRDIKEYEDKLKNVHRILDPYCDKIVMEPNRIYGIARRSAKRFDPQYMVIGNEVTHPELDETARLMHDLDKKIQKATEDRLRDFLADVLRDHHGSVQKIVRRIKDIDVACSHAILANKYRYTRPILEDRKNESFVRTSGVRHPILEIIHEEHEYVPNDVDLDSHHGMLMYGINSAGKSSLLRAIGMSVIMAQIGMFVPCTEMRLTPFRRLWTQIEHFDNMYKGQSMFVVEMKNLSGILSHCDPWSLILMDELTSGTESFSATSLVMSTITRLREKGSRYVLTTHLHEIMNFPEMREEKAPRVCHFDVSMDDGEIRYDRCLREGSGRPMYGVEIAEGIGLDAVFIRTAYDYRERIRSGRYETTTRLVKPKRSRYNKKLIVDRCSACGSYEQLHTHHIVPQKEGDADGYIGHFHKNRLHNLCVLCEKCHDRVHAS
jgi:DNA mismatch repair protein MutS